MLAWYLCKPAIYVRRVSMNIYLCQPAYLRQLLCMPNGIYASYVTLFQPVSIAAVDANA